MNNNRLTLGWSTEDTESIEFCIQELECLSTEMSEKARKTVVEQKDIPTEAIQLSIIASEIVGQIAELSSLIARMGNNNYNK